VARKIKGYVFKERYRESDSAYDEYKAKRCYVLSYGEENVKILNMCNQFGQRYTDIYVKARAKVTGNYKGDIVAIRRVK
jgi:hypothetical protein